MGGLVGAVGAWRPISLGDQLALLYSRPAHCSAVAGPTVGSLHLLWLQLPSPRLPAAHTHPIARAACILESFRSRRTKPATRTSTLPLPTGPLLDTHRLTPRLRIHAPHCSLLPAHLPPLLLYRLLTHENVIMAPPPWRQPPL